MYTSWSGRQKYTGRRELRLENRRLRTDQEYTEQRLLQKNNDVSAALTKHWTAEICIHSVNTPLFLLLLIFYVQDIKKHWGERVSRGLTAAGGSSRGQQQQGQQQQHMWSKNDPMSQTAVLFFTSRNYSFIKIYKIQCLFCSQVWMIVDCL